MDNIPLPDPNISSNQKPLIVKPGLILPRSDAYWDEANAYFRSIFDMSVPITDLNRFVADAQQKVYDYFADFCGTVQQDESHQYKRKYEDKSANELKKQLKQLKLAKAPTAEIRFVSRAIRRKLSPNAHEIRNEEISLDLKRNFWQACLKIFNTATGSIPTFDVVRCYRYFKETLAQRQPTMQFKIPDWIPKLPPPTTDFVDEPPTYKQVATAVNKCKASSSACPLDQLRLSS
jgi:hypothetical protein